METSKSPGAERQRRLRVRKRDAGLVRREVWVDPALPVTPAVPVEVDELPALTGSAKQVAWADQLRREFLARHTSASWWIENRAKPSAKSELI